MSRSSVALMALLLVVSLACGVRGRRGEPERSGFLGDYSQLAPREGYEAALVYVRPGVDWSRYGSIEIDSVTLWATEETVKLSEKDQQMLTDVLYKSLHDTLGEKFTLVDHPRGDTLRIRAALTQAHGSNVALRTITTYVPVGLVLSVAVGNAADVAKNVGQATVEIEVLDPVTRQRLAAAVDSRAGRKNPVSTRTFTTWGDVDAAADFWAERVAAFFVRVGVQTRSPGGS